MQQTIQYQDIIDSLVSQLGETAQKLALAEARIIALTRAVDDQDHKAKAEEVPDAGDPPHEDSTSD